MNNKWAEAFLDYLHPHFPLHLLLLPFTYPQLQLNRELCPVSFPLSIIVPVPGEPLLYVLLGESCLSSVPQLKGFSWPVAYLSLGSHLSLGCWDHLAPLLRRFPSAGSLRFCVFFVRLSAFSSGMESLRASPDRSGRMLQGPGLCSTRRKARDCFLALKEAEGPENLTLQEINSSYPLNTVFAVWADSQCVACSLFPI